MIEQFMLWLCSWAKLFDGLIGILTLGYKRPNMYQAMARELSLYREYMRQERQTAIRKMINRAFIDSGAIDVTRDDNST